MLLPSQHRVCRFDEFEVDLSGGLLTRGGARVKLPDQPFRILALLLEHPGEIVSREQLRQNLWPDRTHVDFDGSLNAALKRLRAALCDTSDQPRYIETIPKRGYRFIGTVIEEIPREAVLTSASGFARPAPALWQSARRVTLLLAAFALVGAGIVAYRLYWPGRRPGKTTEAAIQPVSVRRSVAVLGFGNVSGRPEDEWLSTALSEMLSTELAVGDRLRLVSGEDVANLRRSMPWPQASTLDQQTAARIGAALNGDLLVLGSYTTVGTPGNGQLRLDVRLQDSKTGEILTETAETGGAQDLFHVVSGVGIKLRNRLGVPRLDVPEESGVLASLPTDRDAARLYALGIAKLRQFDLLAARDLLQQACAADPKFSLAHLMLARAWGGLGYEQKHKEEVKKALDLSTGMPRTERMLIEGDYYASLADYEKAASTYGALFALFPDSVEYGLTLANTQYAGGHAKQAAETLAQLRRLPPPASDDPLIDLADARATANNVRTHLALVRSAVRKAAAQGKKLVYAQARRDECMNLVYGEHPEEGPPACEEAYNIFMSMGNRLGAADALRLVGDYQGSLGHLEQAIATYQRALRILEELGEHFKTGAILNNMAINFANEGKLDRAEQLYRQAESHFEQAGDKGNTATALGNIADVVYLRGDLRGAAKLYEQALEILAALDHSDPGYALYRLGDVRLAQGEVQDAHRLAQQAVDDMRPHEGGFQYLTGGMIVLGEVLLAEGDLQGAHQQFQATLEMRQKLGEMDLVGESQVELADIALEEGHSDEAEPLVRQAIAQFEKDKTDPDATSAYTLLSRALLMEGKWEEAHKAVQHAAELSRTSPDPAVKLPIAIQTARVEAAAQPSAGGHAALADAMQSLRAAAATAKKLGYYHLECQARLALGELMLASNARDGRKELKELVDDAHQHGFKLIAREAATAAG